MGRSSRKPSHSVIFFSSNEIVDPATITEGIDIIMMVTPIVHRLASRFHLPTFDGSSNSSARSWVEKLDIYFQLNQMSETEAIKVATLHLDGEAQDWWFHGMVTLGHSTVTTYAEFTRRLMERFDRRDPEQHFVELTRLK